MARAASVAAPAGVCQHRGVSTSTIPTFELRDAGRVTVELVARFDDGDVVVGLRMNAGELGAGTDDPYAYAVRVVVVQAGATIAVRVRSAGGSAYASKPEAVDEAWFESLDGGRSWRPRREPLQGAEVARVGRGRITGWDG
jgi:hypothetical protein